MISVMPFPVGRGLLHTHSSYMIEKRSFPWKKDLMARKFDALCEPSSLHDDLALFFYLLLKERKKLRGRETVIASLLAPLNDSSACKEEGYLHVPRVIVDALMVS